MRTERAFSTRALCSVAIILCAAFPAAMAEDATSELKALMGAETYEAAGLERLSDAERERLYQWLRNRRSQPAAGESDSGGRLAAIERFGRRQDNAFAERPQQDPPDEITTRIQGEFRGWRGETVFRLTNGQVWEQAEQGVFAIAPVQRPEVTIEKGVLGAYYLSVKGYNSSVRVERVPEKERRQPAVEGEVAVSATLKGGFKGWRGDTVFELSNGQIWEQADSGVFAAAPVASPEVRIIETEPETYYLTVAGYERRVRVRRVE